jgi:hypothetical protein
MLSWTAMPIGHCGGHGVVPRLQDLVIIAVGLPVA